MKAKKDSDKKEKLEKESKEIEAAECKIKQWKEARPASVKSVMDKQLSKEAYSIQWPSFRVVVNDLQEN